MAKEFGIKPYLPHTNEEEGDFEGEVDLREPTWAAQTWQREEKHSEMVKPYKWDNYHQQEHFYPDPPFHAEWPHDQPTTELVVDRSDIGVCFITVGGMFNFSAMGCEDYIRVGFIQTSLEDRFNPDRWRAFTTNFFQDPEKITALPKQEFFTVDFSGGDFDMRWYPKIPWNQFPDAEYDADLDRWEVYIRIEYLDFRGSTCWEVQRMLCQPGVCTCPNNFQFDDNGTLDVIGPGGTITLNVLNGCPPYDWSFQAGPPATFGYTLGSPQTAAPNNTLTSATGTCGASYSSLAKIKVTDFCGQTVNFSIRNTGGQWHQPGPPRHAQTTCGSTSLCNPTTYKCLVQGGERWCTAPITRGAGGSCACCQNPINYLNGNTWSAGGGTYPPLQPYQMWTTMHLNKGGCGGCTPPNPGNDGWNLFRSWWGWWGC